MQVCTGIVAEVLSNVGRCRGATGSVQVLWLMHVARLNIMPKIAGINFLLRRCQAATSINVTVEGRSAGRWGGAYLNTLLEYLKQPEVRDASGKDSIIRDHIYTTCPLLQV